jgi:hypothetical protein
MSISYIINNQEGLLLTGQTINGNLNINGNLKASNFSGTTNYIPKFSPNTYSIGNSIITNNSNNVSIGTITTPYRFYVLGVNATAGQPLLAVRDNGRVGINTTSPNAELSIQNVNPTTSQDILTLRNNGTGINTGNSIRFINSTSSSSTVGSKIESIITNLSGRNSIKFYSHGGGGIYGGLLERMSIDGTGKVTAREFNGSVISATTYLNLPNTEFTGNTSATCITDLYISNLHGCSPITINNSIQSSGSTANNTKSIAFGTNAIANATETVYNLIPITIISGCSFTTSDPNNSSPAIILPGDVANEWQPYIWDFCSEFLISGSSGTEILNVGCNVNDIYYDGIGSTYIVDSSLVGNNYTLISGDTFYYEIEIVDKPSFAFGENVLASGWYSHAEGLDTTASGPQSHAEGQSTIASGPQSHAEGQSTIASGSYSHAEGQSTRAISPYSHAEGAETTAGGQLSHAEGYLSKATGYVSHAEGQSTTAQGVFSHTEGNGTFASGQASHAEGSATSASGPSSHAEGSATMASGQFSHTEGQLTTASAYTSHAEGNSTIASGYASHAEGGNTSAIGDYSHAEGQNTRANGDYSHAEGLNTQTNNQYSHAEGLATRANGLGSHSEGQNTTASGGASHAEGSYTVASGQSSHAGGADSVASGVYSFVHSSNSTISGNRSAILGGQNITGSANDTVYVPDFVIKKVAAVPTSSADIIGENGSITWDNTHFYWKANGQWLRVLGSTF